MNADLREKITGSIQQLLKNPKSLDFVNKMYTNIGSLMISTREGGADAAGFARLSSGQVIYIEGFVNENGTAMKLNVLEVDPVLIGEKVALPELSFGDVAAVNPRAAFFGKK